MSTSTFLNRCHQIAAEIGCQAKSQSSPEMNDAESLIGFFQLFRPRGDGLHELFSELDCGEQLIERLTSVFHAAGEGQRPDGGRDAYFIVRSPQPIHTEQAEHYATQWLMGLQSLAMHVGQTGVAEILTSLPRIRILEGIPPKKPKHADECSSLHLAINQQACELTTQIHETDPHAKLLRLAYYFVACDAMLRDYLMWPFYSESCSIADPFHSYFMLWRHGVKIRIFQEDQVDLYLPRQP